MTTQTNTPGPWTICTTQTGKRTMVEVLDRGNVPVCHVYNAGVAYRAKYKQPMEANTRLIAASPELLEALEEIEERADEHMGEWSAVAFDYLPENMEALYELRQAARTAIAKARGTS